MGIFNFFSKSKAKTIKETIISTYYSDYPEIPYISDNRKSEWLEMAELFKSQCIIPKSIMTRYSDGLLPGDIYLLYWLKKYTNKRIPEYFEYQYGIDFRTEKALLEKNGYIENNKPTQKGIDIIEKHFDVIENHLIPTYYAEQKEKDFTYATKYEKEFRPAMDEYSYSAAIINSKWSILFNSKDYNSDLAKEIESLCIENIKSYKKVYAIEKKHHKGHMTKATGYTRLAMLYEKQGKLKEAIEVCKEAVELGLDEKKRLERISKKYYK